jgi:hypothetical protein
MCSCRLGCYTCCSLSVPCRRCRIFLTLLRVVCTVDHVSITVSECDWTIARVSVKVPVLRICVVRIGRGVWRREAAQVGGVVTGAEVVEAGFGVALFAGKMERTVVASGAGEPVAEGEAGAGLVDGGR